MKKLIVLLIIALLLTGCISQNPSTPIERVIYTPIANLLHAAHPNDTYWPGQDPKELVRLYWEVWLWKLEYGQ